jgi:hypothetical protein
MGMAGMQTASIDVHHWTREEYEQMVRQGFLGPEAKVEASRLSSALRRTSR